MTRGDIVTIVSQGDFGKPRPAIVVQSDRLSQTLSVLVCPMTSTQSDASGARLMVPPLPETGLRAISFAMADKVAPIRRQKCGPVIGRIPAGLMTHLNEILALTLGLAD